jgi:hypothetical protein
MVGVSDDAKPRTAAEDEAALARYAADLAAGLEAAVPAWVERSVAETYEAWAGETLPPDVRARAAAAGRAARAEVDPQVRALLATDVDAQRANPLALLRAAVHHPTAVLRAAGVPPVARDVGAERLFPDDVYDLGPAAFADVDPSLHDLGITWGAAKAHVVLQRRRRG